MEDEQVRNPSANTVNSSGTDRMRVLIVGGDAKARLLLSRVIAGDGYLVDLAGDASGALALIARRMYDAILIDPAMPDADGRPFHQAIKNADGSPDRRVMLIAEDIASSNGYVGIATSVDGSPRPATERVELIRRLNALLGLERRDSVRHEQVAAPDQG